MRLPFRDPCFNAVDKFFCFLGRRMYIWILIHDFLTDRKSSILGVWAAPGGREAFQKDGGLRPPPFWKFSRPPGAAQTPQIDDFRSAGYLKAVGLKIVGPVFLGFRQEIDPRTPQNGFSSKSGAEFAQNQPRRPILRPFRVFLDFLWIFLRNGLRIGLRG